MKNLPFIRLGILALAVSLALTACNTANNALTAAINSAGFKKFVTVAQASGRVLCSAEPTAAAIANIVGASAGVGTSIGTAFEAASIACAGLGAATTTAAFSASDSPAVTPKPGTPITGTVVVAGKVLFIEGKVAPPKKGDVATSEIAKTTPVPTEAK